MQLYKITKNNYIENVLVNNLFLPKPYNLRSYQFLSNFIDNLVNIPSLAIVG
jgi:hypothetical protein